MIIPSGFSVGTPSPSVNTPQRSSTQVIRPRSFNTPMPTDESTTTSPGTTSESTPSGNITPASVVSSINPNPNDKAGFLTPSYLTNLMRRCCSRKNFATKLVGQPFDEDSRKKSNVSGKLGKEKLNVVVMDYIKSLTFQYYPLEANEKEEKEWQACVVAIDSNSRSLNRKK